MIENNFIVLNQRLKIINSLNICLSCLAFILTVICLNIFFAEVVLEKDGKNFELRL
ncbi:MAG: hypothetical protein HY810_03025 [Candidatus Omnitrophica bacterium]|nr:hypothetical protein [Candidatus Omnitrophota bacterium]